MKVWTVLFVVMLVAASPSIASADENVSLRVSIYKTGDAEVYQKINISTAPTLLHVEPLGEPYIVEAYYADNTPAPASIAGNGSITVEAYMNGTITLHYLTALAEKQGKIWVVNITSATMVALTLPEGATPIYVNPEPEYVDAQDGSVTLYFQPGTVYLEYLQAPATASSPPVNGGDGGEDNTWLPVAAAAAALLASMLAYHLYKRRKASYGGPGSVVSGHELAVLDERDRQIVEYIRGRGEATASEIMKALDIPKTPLYRRLNKLVRYGVLEEVPGPTKRFRVSSNR